MKRIVISFIKNRGFLKRRSILLAISGPFLLLLLTTFVLSGYGQTATDERVFPADYPVLHPQFRKWPSPALNNKVQSVSPILLWPITKKAGGYDIRLSQDASFPDPKTITGRNIPWTIYNPHQRLTEGTWYWQYRVHQGDWSQRMEFRIPENANQDFAPPVEKFFSAILDAHPRVLIDRADKQLFAEQNRATPDGEAILKEANTWVTKELPTEKDAESKIEGSSKKENAKIALVASEHASNQIYHAVDLFCKAYILTSDNKFKQKAILWAMSVASWDPDGVSYLSDFGDARCMVAMALAFDTFYDQLDNDQRQILISAIDKRANRFYRGWINNIDAKVLSNHVWQYILHYFFQTAIALYGETDNAGNWIRYAYELWLARAPVLGGDDGGWCEGASYFRLNMETLLDIPMIIKRYTGFDFIKNTDWYQKNPYWMAYSFPAGSSSDGFGDDVEKIYSPGAEYLAYADALSRLTDSRMAAWYARQIEVTGKNKQKKEIRVNGVASYSQSNNKTIKLTDANMLRWFRMRYLHGLERPAPINPLTLPAGQIFRSTGVVDLHSSINERDNDLMISMRSSPYGSYGHLLGDQNTFNVLFGGDRLFYMSGHKVAMQDPHRLQWYKATQGHNGILIDGKGQPFNVEAYGYLPRFVDGKNISCVVGDASQAYSSEAEGQQTGLTKFRRHLLFLHPDILLIYDELEADHPANWSWLIHSPYKIKIDELQDRFSCRSSKVVATTSFFSSQKFHWQLSDTFGIAAVNWLGRKDEDGNLVEFKNDQWHLTAATVNKSNKARFLAIMQIQNNGKVRNEMPIKQFDAEGDMHIGDWVIHAELDTDKPVLMEAFNRKKHISFTSGAEKLKIDEKTYVGKTPGSAKLVELVNGDYIFSEADDVLPDVVKEVPPRIEK